MANFVKSGKKIMAIGRNYAAHIAELNSATPTEPFFFLKPTTSYLPSKGIVEIPKGIHLHHEVELGVVIGKPGRDIAPRDAMKHVAGYCLAIDYTARNLQNVVKAKSLPWTSVKGFDTFCPVSEFVPKKLVKNPHKLELWFKVNGVDRQRESTELMLNQIPEMVRHCSGIMRFEKGDLLLTGTPAGVSRIVAGDVITAGMTQDGVELARIEHTVVDREGGYEFKE